MILRLRFATGIAIALALLSFTLIYTTLWPFVGRFPAESLAASRADALSARALCYDQSDTSRNISPGFPGRSGAKTVSLRVRARLGLGPQLGQVAASRALFYSVYDRQIYQINELDPSDVALLKRLAFWGLVDRRAVVAFVAAATPFSPACAVPNGDEGVTEAYWATKGTSVLHHWAFLYDGAVSDGKPVHAQYGFLVARLAREIATAIGPRGPTQFVRVAWGFFWFVGICYCIAFLFVFRANLAIASAGLAWQIASFASIGPFSILLAPGYHWSKELVMIIPPLLLTVVGNSRERSRRIFVFTTFVALVSLAFALDTTFAIVAAGCLALGFGTCYWRAIRDLAKARPILLFASGIIAVLGASVAFVADASNLGYAFSKTAAYGLSALGDPSRNITLEFNAAAALITLVLCARKRLSVVAAYYAYLSIISFEYYAITPDSFHFAKYVEYVVPIYVVLAMAAYSWLTTYRWGDLLKPLADIGTFVVIAALLGSSYSSVTAMPPYWQLRVTDSIGAPYFSSDRIFINGRLIDANLNAQTVARLDAFPQFQRYDFIISALDKYVLFLFDEHNGFTSADATAWMDSDARLAQTEDELTKRHATALLDGQELRVDPLAALLSSHPLVGGINSQSVLAVQSRVRMSELAAFVTSHCSTAPIERSRLWYLAKC